MFLLSCVHCQTSVSRIGEWAHLPPSAPCKLTVSATASTGPDSASPSGKHSAHLHAPPAKITGTLYDLRVTELGPK